MKLGVYSLGIRKNRIAYYSFHGLIGMLIIMAIQVLYVSYFIDKLMFVEGIQFLLIALVSFLGGNFLMLRGNECKIKYIKQGLLVTGATVVAGILIMVILRVV